MARGGRSEMHDFYCTLCGQKAWTLPRPRSRQRERMHLKRLYCYHCQQDVNCVEVRSYEDLFEFKQNFEDGLYKDIALNFEGLMEELSYEF